MTTTPQQRTRVTIRLRSDHLAAIDEAAAAEDLDRSDIIRRALNAWITKHDAARN